MTPPASGLLRPLRWVVLGAALLTAWPPRPGRAADTPPALPAAGTRLAGTPGTIAGSATVQLRQLAREDRARPAPLGPLQPTVILEGEEPPEPEGTGPGSNALSTSAAIGPFAASPAATTNFAGLDDIAKVGTSNIVIPPDVDGAVGLTKVMETLNNNYRVFDKGTGSVSSTVSINTFWAPAGAASPFDPKVLYDPFNDRWILCGVSGAGLASSSVLLGVSLTDDPEGSYFLFRVTADPAGVNWADFPTIGFNHNWVAINVNMVNISTGASAGSKCLVADYAQLRSGALVSTFFAGTGFCSSPAATYSTTENTLYVPTHLTSSSGTFRIDLVTGTPTAPVYTVGATKNRGLTWVQPGGQILPQSAPLAGSSACSPPCRIETQDAQIRSTPVVRNGALYYTQTVGLPSSGITHTGVLWTKLDPTNGSVLDGGVIQDPTATATNGGKWYAYPHIAVNACGDAIVGYSRFASTQHPEAGYSFRYGADATGALRDPVIYKSGEDYYHKTFGSGRNRWGDYGKAQVDPSDDLSLWVVDEYAKLRIGTDDGNGGTNGSRWGTWWAKLSPTLTLAAGPSQAEGTGGTTPFDFTVSFPAPLCVPVRVDYAVTNGTATLADGDYQPLGDFITIPAGAASGTITVDVIGDSKREPDETFRVTLVDVNPGVLGATILATGTILNDDPVPTLSIADAAAPEGNAGASPLSFLASLSNPTTQTVTAHYQTSDGTATVADGDYLAGFGTLTIAPGATTGTVSVTMTADTRCEPDETIGVTLSAPSGATLGDAQAAGTIQNDDDCAPPTVTVTAPNDVEVHLIGEPLDLTWNATDDIGVTAVDLSLSRDAGGSYEDIALGHANDGSYMWTVTGPETHEALLRVTAHDAAGNAASDVSDALWQIVQTVAVGAERPVTELALGPAAPSPARGETRIAFALPRAAAVRLEVLDVQGRRVASLVEGEQPAGRHSVTWNARRAGSGVYVVRLDASGKVLMRRVVVTR